MTTKTAAGAITVAVILGLALYRCNYSFDASRAGVAAPEILQGAPEETLPPAAIEQIMHEAMLPSQSLPEAFFDQLPASLDGVGAPVRLPIDEEGVLVVDYRLKQVFEHYLTAIGEEPLEIIVARIQHYLQHELDASNTGLAMNLLEGYLQYRNHIGVIINSRAVYDEASSFDLQTIVDVKRQIRESRVDFLPADAADALLGQDDAYDDYMLDRLRLQNDRQLSEPRRAQALAELEQRALQMGTVRPTMSSALALSRQESATLRDAKASEESIFESRRALLGEEAATRMAQLDEERRLWQQRVDAYRRELVSIDAYPEEEKKYLAEQVRQRHFQGAELVRIRALDKHR